MSYLLQKISDILDSKGTDIVSHVTHDRIDGAGSGIAAEPVERMHMNGKFVIFLDRQGRFGRLGQNLRFAAAETFEISQQIANIFFPEGQTAFSFGRPVFRKEDLIEENHSFAAFRPQDQCAVADSGIHVGTEDLPVRISEKTRFGGGPDRPAGIL